MRNILVEEFTRPEKNQRVEVVERKGLGHPDSICDALMDRVSVALCEEYLKKAGTILHHNVDKGLLVAGETKTKFGGGSLTKPMLLIFGDRATSTEDIDPNKIAVKTAKEWFKENLRFVDPEKHVKYLSEIKSGSEALTDIFKRKSTVLGANDTSAAVGYAPLTITEKLVLQTERYLNSDDFKNRFPESGEDIKVMGLRTNKHIDLIVAMAMVDRYVKNEQDYFRKKEEIVEEVRKYANENSEGYEVHVELNSLDAKGRGVNGVYLTVLGTSADGADCGEVGRGNRVNGLIPLNRPIGSEAAAGKNPVSHVGKIYNVLTHKIADRVYKNVPGVEEVYIWLLSRIGQPIDHPAVAAAQVKLKKGVSMKEVEKHIHAEIDEELADIQKFCMDLAHGKYPVC
jgi:S-adenosylmethionine synthetase